MFNKKGIAGKVGFGALAFAATVMMNGCDDSYDLNKLGGDVTLFENGVSAPVGDTDKFYLKDFIEENEFLKVDDQGRYMIEYSGQESTSLSFPVIDVPAIAPVFTSTHLDFFESVRSNPELESLISIIETAMGGDFDHYSAIPEVKNPLTGENIPLVVPGVHAQIERSVERFEIDIYDIPEELISVSSIGLGEGAEVEFSLHAEGFPKTIDEITLDFYIHPPVQLHITPVDESIEVVRQDYFHVKHTLPCIDGKLDDKVLFRLEEIVFSEPMERDADGKLAIFAEMDYEGRIDIDSEFDLAGWTPVLDLNVQFAISDFTVDAVDARVQAAIDPISFSQEISGLPEILTQSGNCLDLEYLTFALNINNGTPATLEADFMLQSTFHDETTSGEIGTEKPLVVEANKLQHIVISNDEQYAGQPGYIPRLNEVMYKIPRLLALKANPRIPATDIKLNLNDEFNVAIDYSLAVPIVFGGDFQLSLSGDFGDLGADIAALSENAVEVELAANIVSTLPIDVELNVKPVDANGNVLKGITLTGVPLTVKGNETTPLDIIVSATANNELDKLYTLQYELAGRAAGDSNELRPDQYLQFTDITLSLPQGISVMLK